MSLPVEKTITYNDILVQNPSDNLPLKVLDVQDSDGDTQALVNLDLNSVKILENKTTNTVTLDVPVSQIRLTDVYAKDVTIPLDFQIIPPILKAFGIKVYNLVSRSTGYDVHYIYGNGLTKNNFSYTSSSIRLHEDGVGVSTSDIYLFIQICYQASGFESGYYRIILDKVNGGSLMSSSFGGAGYYIYPNSYYYEENLSNSISAGLVSDNTSRVLLVGYGDVPGINRQDVSLFSIYDDNYIKVSDGGNNEDEVGNPQYNEGAVLRLSPQMISLSEWFN